MTATSDFPFFASNDALALALRQAAVTKNLRAVDVAIWFDGSELRACYSHQGRAASEGAADGYQARVGCLAKHMSATLVARACADGRVRLTDDLATVFASSVGVDAFRERLASYRVMDLLNHSHGLDDSGIPALPRSFSGRINLGSLCSELLSKPPLAPVGEYFNYGGAGAWLAAALLEHIYDRSYEELLRDNLLKPIGLGDKIGGDSICPANGGNLRMDAADLVKLTSYHLSSGHRVTDGESIVGTLNEFRRQQFQPRGWQPKLRRVCLGVNDYGNGWYGHNSKFMGDSAVIRFNPELNAAVAITSSPEEGAHATLGALFWKAMPEFSAKTMPKPIDAEQWQDVRVSKYFGTYENQALSLTIDVAANKSLRVRVHAKSELASGNQEPYIKRYLRPAENEVFFSNPAEPLVVPFLQFMCLEDASSEGYKYVQNGRQLFVRR